MNILKNKKNKKSDFFNFLALVKSRVLIFFAYFLSVLFLLISIHLLIFRDGHSAWGDATKILFLFSFIFIDSLLKLYFKKNKNKVLLRKIEIMGDFVVASGTLIYIFLVAIYFIFDRGYIFVHNLDFYVSSWVSMVFLSSVWSILIFFGFIYIMTKLPDKEIGGAPIWRLVGYVIILPLLFLDIYGIYLILKIDFDNFLSFYLLGASTLYVYIHFWQKRYQKYKI